MREASQGCSGLGTSSAGYIIGSPLFDEVTLHMGNGKNLIIRARNNSDKNLYIQSLTLNGRPWNKPWFRHADIANGATWSSTWARY